MIKEEITSLVVHEWYNVVPDLPVEIPPSKNSDGGNELQVLKSILPKSLQDLNNSLCPIHKIPDDVLTNYVNNGRPTPLARAERLEKYLDTPARIYFKREDVLPTGSFKQNTAFAQVSQAQSERYKGVVTETGAGQWGLALSAASAVYGMKCRIYMARCSYEQKYIRRKLMEMFGAEVYPSPSDTTEAGRKARTKMSAHPGSIGMGISEAIEFACNNPSYAYATGSNFPFVYTHQSVMGRETARQLRALSEVPDVVIACLGGGSNFAGFVFPMIFGQDSFAEKPDMLACESSVTPRLTKGKYEYDHGDPAGLTPLIKSYTLGMDFIPPPTHVGGLRQHNGSALIGALYANGFIKAKAYDERTIFEAGALVAHLEGIFPAPESCHALCGTIEMAQEAARQGRESVIVCCISGSGILDMAGYTQTLNLEDCKNGVHVEVNRT